MIKCEVVFDGDQMSVNGWIVYQSVGCFIVNGRKFKSREQAIKYCLETERTQFEKLPDIA